jgi:hypothetical protein
MKQIGEIVSVGAAIQMTIMMMMIQEMRNPMTYLKREDVREMTTIVMQTKVVEAWLVLQLFHSCLAEIVRQRP